MQAGGRGGRPKLVYVQCLIEWWRKTSQEIIRSTTSNVGLSTARGGVELQAVNEKQNYILVTTTCISYVSVVELEYDTLL